MSGSDMDHVYGIVPCPGSWVGACARASVGIHGPQPQGLLVLSLRVPFPGTVLVNPTRDKQRNL